MGRRDKKKGEEEGKEGRRRRDGRGEKEEGRR
jgi:hypothetical protein